jgi:hypothetical protein
MPCNLNEMKNVSVQQAKGKGHETSDGFLGTIRQLAWNDCPSSTTGA